MRTDLIQNRYALKHGLTPRGKPPRLYNIWRGMKTRCSNKNGSGYKYYGARGIKLCKRWHAFEVFYEDLNEAYQTHCKEYGIKNTTLDRLNNNGDYSQKNCRWATWTQQNNNSRMCRNLTYDGLTLNITQWAKRVNLKYVTLYRRLFIMKWSIEEALTTPVRRTM